MDFFQGHEICICVGFSLPLVKYQQQARNSDFSRMPSTFDKYSLMQHTYTYTDRHIHRNLLIGHIFLQIRSLNSLIIIKIIIIIANIQNIFIKGNKFYSTTFNNRNNSVYIIQHYMQFYMQINELLLKYRNPLFLFNFDY